MGNKLTYKQLKELIEDRPDEDEVVIIYIGDDNKFFTLEPFTIENKLVLTR